MANPEYDWYLAEWLHTLQKRQADLVRDLNWNKARVSLLVHGQQQYTREIVNQIALYLHVLPYELLMHPEDAMRMRRLRDAAISIAADSQRVFRHKPQTPKIAAKA
jgi:plasmid maintenance system antidote protein VapI